MSRETDRPDSIIFRDTILTKCFDRIDTDVGFFIVLYRMNSYSGGKILNDSSIILRFDALQSAISAV